MLRLLWGCWKAFSTILNNFSCAWDPKICSPFCSKQSGSKYQLTFLERTSNPSAAVLALGKFRPEKKVNLLAAKVSQCHVRCRRVGLVMLHRQVTSVCLNFESMRPSTPAPVITDSCGQLSWSSVLPARFWIWKSGHWLLSAGATRLSLAHKDFNQSCSANAVMDFKESHSKFSVPCGVCTLPESETFQPIRSRSLL